MLLTGLLVAIWPVATAHACCCAAGAAIDGDKCAADCCASAEAAGSCCGATDDGGICCVASAQRDACGCGDQCGQGKPERNAAGLFPKSSAAPLAALGASGWIALWPAIRDDAADGEADAIPRRPKRILFSVWRN